MPPAGLAGSIFTEWCGERPRCIGVLDRLVDTEFAELVELAFECVWWWWWIDRIDEIDELVDFLPRSPVDGRRTAVERGVIGDGDSDCRLCHESMPATLVSNLAGVAFSRCADDDDDDNPKLSTLSMPPVVGNGGSSLWSLFCDRAAVDTVGDTPSGVAWWCLLVCGRGLWSLYLLLVLAPSLP